ncbi:RidA family protein [Denitrobaculum tricleocarpae]|uniref:RidA family protein n=1 Tax=Denitrobaculum tricleocarpae TaxID=2591009 RepID=A0A545TG07_9PROT|nr:RidA family protein [Denitrobaculum tricleocarpae]TQV76135.1 RidA family protein [Denitrobaculum tricleocarpae]
MLSHHTPESMRAPFALYSHGVVVPPGTHVLFGSGQLGITQDDKIPEDAAAQAELCFESIGKLLRDAGMGFEDLVRINAFVTDRSYLPAYMAVRDSFIESPPPASTLMIVSGFAREIFKVEIEVVAAKNFSK